MCFELRRESIAEMEEISSQFEFQYKIGRGSWGEVYVAHWKEKDLKIVLKVMEKERVCTSQAALENLSNELKFLKEFRDSPWVTQLVLARNTENALFLGLKFLRGGDLQNLKSKIGRLEGNALKFLVAEMAFGINELHKRGVIHGDLKPANIMLDRRGHIVIVDMGFARRLGPQEISWDQPGTPLYVSLKRQFTKNFFTKNLFTKKIFRTHRSCLENRLIPTTKLTIGLLE